MTATLVACNGAAEWVPKVAWEQQVFRNYDLRGRTYGQVKAEFGLSAQPAQHVIKKVADAYRADRATRRRFRPLAGAIVKSCGLWLGMIARCPFWDWGSWSSIAPSCCWVRLRGGT
jgi:hypothetical protein